VAIYKLAQSIGAGIAYALTSAGVDGGTQFICNWVLVAGSLGLARESWPAYLHPLDVGADTSPGRSCCGGTDCR
jgi:hypothetical protein